MDTRSRASNRRRPNAFLRSLQAWVLILPALAAGCGTGPDEAMPGDDHGNSATEGNGGADGASGSEAGTEPATTPNDDGGGDGDASSGDDMLGADGTTGPGDSGQDDASSTGSDEGGDDSPGSGSGDTSSGDADDGMATLSGDEGDSGDEDLAEDSGNGHCDAVEVDFVAGQHSTAGVVELHMTGDAILVEVHMEEPWLLGILHVYVGDGPPPNNGNSYVPGKFPVAHQYDPPVDWASIEIPLADIAVGCDEALTVAVHGNVYAGAGEDAQAETAWAQGPLTMGNSWGMAFLAAMCCP